MPRQENTKEIILYEAMKLFADKGYDAVKITEISDAVGCVPSALYKHYNSKKKIYDEILERSYENYEASQGIATMDFSKHPEIRKHLLSVDEKGFGDFLLMHFQKAIENVGATLFRKLMTVEQYKDPKLAKLYDERYVFNQIERYKRVFDMYKEEGRLPNGDPETLAYMMVSNSAALFGVIDRNPDKLEWAYSVVRSSAEEIFREYIK